MFGYIIYICYFGIWFHTLSRLNPVNLQDFGGSGSEYRQLGKQKLLWMTELKYLKYNYQDLNLIQNLYLKTATIVSLVLLLLYFLLLDTISNSFEDYGLLM